MHIIIITYIRLLFIERIRRTGIVIKINVVAECFIFLYSLDFNSVSCEGTTERYAYVGHIIGRTTSQFLFMAATSLVQKRVVIISSDSVGDNNAARRTQYCTLYNVPSTGTRDKPVVDFMPS